MNQLATQRVMETLDGVLCGTISRLQWDTSISKSGTNLQYHTTISRQHSFQSWQSSMNHTEISHLCDSFVLFRPHFLHRRENRNHRVVDPNIDGTELTFNCFRSVLNCLGIGHVRCYHEGFAAQRFNISSRSFETVTTARDESDVRSLFAKSPSDRSTQTRRSASDNYHLGRGMGFGPVSCYASFPSRPSI